MPATVLVVEDDREIRELLRRYLERAGYAVHTTASGAEAITLVDEASVALIVLDLTLPDVDGLDVLTAAGTSGDGIPVVVLTARDSTDERIRGLRLGADDYVTKPFTPTELVLRVQAVLHRTNARAGAGPARFGDGRLCIDEARHEATLVRSCRQYSGWATGRACVRTGLRGDGAASRSQSRSQSRSRSRSPWPGNLFVRDMDEVVVWPSNAQGRGMHGRGAVAMGAATTATVVIDGVPVGSVRVNFGSAGMDGTAGTSGRSVAWAWVAGAAVVALVVAIAVSRYVSRRLTRPLIGVTRTARAFAAGDRSARSDPSSPGELGELALALNPLADQVVRTDQVRRRLAADVAHELRTPLTALQAALEELRDGLVEPAPARLGDWHDQTLRLGRVVGDLAHLAAAESAALSLRLATVDLAAVIAGAVDSQQPRLRAAGRLVRRAIDGPILVRADADRLHQAIVNLLANAARYGRGGDSVLIRVGSAGGSAAVEVADSGPGIAPADLPYVFDRLWRGGASAAVSGSGIGLAVVRELVTAHGGTVTARSAPSEGACFSIALPIADGAPHPG